MIPPGAVTAAKTGGKILYAGLEIAVSIGVGLAAAEQWEKIIKKGRKWNKRRKKRR